MVLQRLNKYGLKENLKKCEFLKDSLEFCGHKIDKDGLHKMRTKTEAVMSAPRPENVSQLRAFLGLVNYYHKFLPNLATELQGSFHYDIVWERASHLPILMHLLIFVCLWVNVTLTAY